MRLVALCAFVALGFTPALNAQTSAQQPLNLSCVGAGTASKATFAQVEGYGGSATITSRHDRGFEDQTDIRLFSGDDRIRLPRTLLPPLHGGSDGWFRLKDVVVDARSIHASAAVNFMNNPKVFIDRVPARFRFPGRREIIPVSARRWTQTRLLDSNESNRKKCTSLRKGRRMLIQQFEITNFRGVQHTIVQLDAGSPGKVVTLIGLNESGKTTILEAISNFVSTDTATQSLVETVYAEVDPITFIPKERRGLFTDDITIEADVLLESEDIEAVRRALWSKHSVKLIPDSLDPKVNIEQAFEFQDSVLKRPWRRWSLSFKYTKGNNGYVPYIASGDIWQTAVSTLNSRVPQIVYFPTFLFSMPGRIYLSVTELDHVKDSYYRRVFSDVLQYINPEYSLQTHVLDRINKIISQYGVSALSDSTKADHVDSVIRAASNEISGVIMGAWKDILDKEDLQLRVELKWGLDETRDNAVYIEPHLIERQQFKYVLKERSLGFRWFFSFLLFTQFRSSGAGEHGTIFLFDEPASHLHPAAQVELLNSLNKIMGPKDRVIYSTHSHYLINPIWLEKAYIINNQAIDLDKADFASFMPTTNDIVAIRYKKFVSDNPTRMNYFQPALDALKVKLSPLHLTGPAIIVEGKYDYYPFIYMLRRTDPDLDIHVFSALGAGEMGIVASILRGLGLNFVAILDADHKGKSEYNRYRTEYQFSEEQVMTLDEGDVSLDGKSFEGIYQNDVVQLIEDAGIKKDGKDIAKSKIILQ